MSISRNLLVALTVASALTLGTFSPALAADEHQPTTSEAAGALATSDQLAARATQDAAARDSAQARLEAVSLAASNKLEAYSLAVRAQQQATMDEQAAQDRLAAAQKAVAARKAQLGQWVRITYQQGLGLQGDPALTTLLVARSQNAGTTLAVLRRLGQDQVATLAGVESAAADQEQATAAAATAAQTASATAVKASAAKDAAQLALAQQRDLLAAADAALSATTKNLTAASTRETLISSPGTASGRSNGVIGTVGSCKGGQIELYRNGRIPLAALCALAASPTQYLRADAAYAFNRLSNAYTQQFGVTPCITDSYRTYKEQVQLFKVKPGLAAKPGTSNHGWGTAVDLCGGIQTYGTTAYRWMLINAPQYGWFHPSWARKGAGREEPWHWEFAGVQP